MENYGDVYWAVIVYDDVTGSSEHAVRGTFFSLFHHYGHNIVVGKVTSPLSRNAPSDYQLSIKFWEAYRPTYRTKCIDFLCLANYPKLDSKPSVDNTWDTLVLNGLFPEMLHMFTSEIDYGIGSNFDDGMINVALTDGGRATLIY